jgi:hypothetical protein
MIRYINWKGLGGRLGEVFPIGEPVDLLSDEAKVFAWTDKESRLQSRREEAAFHVQSDGVHFLGIALVATAPDGVNLSGGRLRIGYRSAEAIEPVAITLKPVVNPQAVGLISKEIFTRFEPTKDREAEIDVPLPAMPGLTNIKEVVITHEPGPGGRAIDLTLTRVECAP